MKLQPHVIPLVEQGSVNDLAKFLKSQNAKERAYAYQALNVIGRKYTDYLKSIHAKGLHLSSYGNMPESKQDGIDTVLTFGTADREAVDASWVNLFTIYDRRSSNQRFFKIDEVYDAVEFRDYLPGERVQLRHVEAERNVYEYRLSAGGLQWLNIWQDDTELWEVSDGIAAMEIRYAQRQANIAFQILTAAGLTNVAYDSGGASQVEKDVNTINACMTGILKDIYEATRPDGEQKEEVIENPRFYLLYNSLTAGYSARINRALTAQFGLANDTLGQAQLDYPIIPMGSPRIATGKWYISLPGRKNVYAIKQDLVVNEHMDPFVAGGATAEVGHGRYQFVRGDSRQVRSMDLS